MRPALRRADLLSFVDWQSQVVPVDGRDGSVFVGQGLRARVPVIRQRDLPLCIDLAQIPTRLL